MRRMNLVGVAFLLLLLPLLLAATQASTRTEIVRALERDGYFVEAGAEQVDSDRLAAVVRGSRADLRPVILADAAVDGEEQLADDILNALGSGTVVVLSPDNIGVSTDRADDAAVDAAFDRAEDQTNSRTDLVGYLEAFDRALVPAVSRGAVVRVIVLAGLVLLTGAMLITRARRRRAERAWQERMLREARQEVGSQISIIADRIVDLHGRVELAGEGEVSRLYTAATDTYSSAQRHLEQSSSVSELERVSDELDRARWQLESVTALLDGKEPPPEPDKRVACFFDPNHGAGTRQTKLRTPAGERDLRVCADCAAKLEAGEAPQPRMIDVGGQRVPAAKAPRAYGGGGFGYLDDFTVLMGGRRYPYGWGGAYGPGLPRRRRSWFGGWWGGGPARGTWSGSSWGSGSVRRRRSWSSGTTRRSWSSGSSGTRRSWSSNRGRSGRSRSISRGSASRSRSVRRGGGSRSRSVRRGGGSRRR